MLVMDKDIPEFEISLNEFLLLPVNEIKTQILHSAKLEVMPSSVMMDKSLRDQCDNEIVLTLIDRVKEGARANFVIYQRKNVARKIYENALACLTSELERMSKRCNYRMSFHAGDNEQLLSKQGSGFRQLRQKHEQISSLMTVVARENRDLDLAFSDYL